MLAIIPARAGSKGVPGKNRRNFCGKPLIQWTLDHARFSNAINQILVTTNDENILRCQIIQGLADKILKRPEEISSDKSPAIEYIHHALTFFNKDQLPEYFCVLQPTSPLRNSKDIDGLYSLVKSKKLNCGVTVVDVPHNFVPESLMRVDGDVVVPNTNFRLDKNLRQHKSQYVARNGAAVYVCRTDYFISNKSLFDNQMAFWKMSMLESIDIDNEDDFKLAELIMENKIKCSE